MKIFKLLFAMAFSILLIGCSNMKPIDEPSYHANGFTMAQMEKSILNAQNTNRGWVLKKKQNGLITGTLLNRGYTAEVEIPYSASGYTIKYKYTSPNLKKDGQNIHRVYNRWIANLNMDIQKELLRL